MVASSRHSDFVNNSSNHSNWGQQRYSSVYLYNILKMDRKTNLETSLVIVTGLLIIYFFKTWNALLIIAAGIGITGIFFDKPATYVTWLWTQIGHLFGKVVPKIILAIVFYLFLFPISLLRKVSVRLKYKNAYKKNISGWLERDYYYKKKDLLNPW